MLPILIHNKNGRHIVIVVIREKKLTRLTTAIAKTYTIILWTMDRNWTNAFKKGVGSGIDERNYESMQNISHETPRIHYS
jgi:hypothetical protein